MREQGEAYREVRAVHTDSTIRVYQAYPAEIADAALAAGTFAPPFKRDRMTWVKPSFLWMAYRCGYADKAGQERVLAVDISREGFHWAIGRAVLSHFDAAVHGDHATWSARVAGSPVRVQWDPERGLRHEALGHRSLQLGLRGEAVRRYVDEWVVGLTDVTPLMREVGRLVRAGETARARELLPRERVYPLEEQDISALAASR
ncbi:DUF4291 domain-containing protein [Actinokineospora spheciospongiae]|uniref:DUF4291 domain-containing protein n=1 Tax=Actinokineospora spheciospongiae TaxID=909613 RepID=UPI000557D025|nr:DUF4291 domain-containing protein [Actinokineospora spheciospongiae]